MCRRGSGILVRGTESLIAARRYLTNPDSQDMAGLLAGVSGAHSFHFVQHPILTCLARIETMKEAEAMSVGFQCSSKNPSNLTWRNHTWPPAADGSERHG